MSTFRSFLISLATHTLVAANLIVVSKTSVQIISLDPPEPGITVDYGGSIGQQKSLYEAKGDLYNLSPQELDELASGSFRGCDVWHVAFYSDGCPRCQAEAPISKRLASAFVNQTKLCFGVFNCNLDGVFGTKCAKLNITSYPTKWFFNLHLPANPPSPTPTKHPQYGNVYEDPNVQASFSSVNDVAQWYSQVTSAEHSPVHELDPNAMKPRGWPLEAFGHPKERVREGMHGFVLEFGKRIEHLSQDLSSLLKHGGEARPLLHILQRGFPSGEHHLLFAQLEAQMGGKSSTGSPAKKLLENPQKRLILQPSSAIWTVFHAISFSAIPPADKLDFVHGFMKSFFPCRSCRSHFLHMWDSGEYGRRDIKTAEDVQYYLWMLHNTVNVRVGDASRLWPPRASCPACYDGADMPNRAAILQFLKETYVDDSSTAQGRLLYSGNPGSHLSLDMQQLAKNLRLERPRTSSKSWTLRGNAAMWLIAFHVCLW
eukprot:GEMP01024840.1.p1 GENE.GEMP01024840.1~~GEMP01024840.1.p1  ORF type:complete len:485 (+),score=91.83 GEMP01024840.1:335-1789(+)